MADRNTRSTPNLENESLSFPKRMKLNRANGYATIQAQYRQALAAKPPMSSVPALAFSYLQAQQQIDELYKTYSNSQVAVCGSQEYNMLALQAPGADVDGNDTSAKLTKWKHLTDKTFRQAAAGGQCSVLVDNDGKVYTWGVNDEGSLGHDGGGEVPRQVTGLPPIVQVAAGENFSLALDVNGHVWFWGMFRDCDQKKYAMPNDEGEIKGFRGEPMRIKELKNVIRVVTSSSANAAAVILKDQSILTFGKCDYNTRLLPIVCSEH